MAKTGVGQLWKLPNRGGGRRSKPAAEGSIHLGPSTVAGTGAVVPALVGTGAITLGPSSVAGTGSVAAAPGTFNGTGVITLGPSSVTGTGSVTPVSAEEWQSTPSPTFTIGTASNPDYDLTQHLASGGTGRVVALESGTLPDGVSIVTTDGAQALHYDGTDPSVTALDIELSSVASAEADWDARISDPGVVWYHDFESAAEVNQFRWSGGYGNNPGDIATTRPANTVRWNQNDGITGGCLELFRATGLTEGSVWWRPFAPMNSTSNGRGVADPAADNTISLASFTPTNNGSQTQNFFNNNYSHSTVPASFPSLTFDGTEFYLQCRVKMDPNRALTGPNGGKLFYFTRTEASAPAQEIVVQSRRAANGSSENMFGMYRSGGLSLEADDRPNSGESQPRSEWANPGEFCSFVNNPAGYVNNCWYWTGGWDTILWRIKPGRNGVSETEIDVWACRAGEEAGGYVRIWNQTLVPMPYTSGFGNLNPAPAAYNALICSIYQNGDAPTPVPTTLDFTHRYCQMIFSHNFIPCPAV